MRPREQRRLARVRQPDEPDVRQQLQPQLEPALLARQAALGEARRLAGGRREVRVAAPAAAAAGHDGALARRGQVPAHAALGVLATVPGGTAHLERTRARAVAVGALAVPAALGLQVRAGAGTMEVAQRRVGDEHHVAAAAAVAAVGPALGHVGLAAEGDDPVAARAALDEDRRATES